MNRTPPDYSKTQGLMPNASLLELLSSGEERRAGEGGGAAMQQGGHQMENIGLLRNGARFLRGLPFPVRTGNLHCKILKISSFLN